MNQALGAAALIAIVGVATTGEYLLDEPGLREKAAVASLGRTRIPLAQAVGLAERHLDGRAIQAGLEVGRETVVAQVKIVTAGHQVFDVEVDAINGSVLSSRPRPP